jgi:C4-dicarboxylate-specific signal transduction histidine kinase
MITLNLQGEERTYEVSLSKLDLDESIIIFSTDVHDKVLLQKQDERHRLDLAAATRLTAVGEMSAGIAHEINNPLAAISGRTLLLKRKISKIAELTAVDREALDEGLDKISSMSERIAKIVRGLKTFSRNGEGLASESLSISDVVEDILGFSTERIKFLGIELRLQISKEDRVWANRVALSQVILNLLNNSIDAISHTTAPWLEISTRSSSDLMEILVTDSGTGIPKAIQDKIMEPFFTTKEVGKGTGLGLSVSRGLVQSMNGTLRLDGDHPNTRFVVSLKQKG